MAPCGNFRFITYILICLMFYILISIFVFERFNRSIVDKKQDFVNINEVPSKDTFAPVAVALKIPFKQITQHCGSIETANTLSSCIRMMELVHTVNASMIQTLCQNVVVLQSEFAIFEAFMTPNPWFHYRITCVLPSNGVLVSLYMKYNHELIIKFYGYLSYIQYTASNVSYYGVNQQIWMDYHMKCLFRYFGSTLMIFHAELDHAFSHLPPQRYNPMIPCWIHVDKSWCNATNHWHCYFLPPYVESIFHYQHPQWFRIDPVNEMLKEWREKYTLVQRRMQLVAFLTRPNLRFERMLFELNNTIKHWKFDEEKCTALHLRYGDKVQECDELGDNCHFKIGVNEYLEQTLSIANKAEANVVFIMTDDVSKCIQTNDTRLQPRADYAHLTFYCIGGKGQLLDGWFDEYMVKDKDATVEFALLVLSLRWAQHCVGFVGNFDSNIASLAYMYMCDYHDGKCPYHYSFDSKHLDFPILSWG